LLRATAETHQGEFVHKFPVELCCDSFDNPMAKREWRCNVLYVMEHRLDIILKLQIKKVSKTVETIIQNDNFNEFITINSMPYSSVDC
jgi:hypothetical protein